MAFIFLRNLIEKYLIFTFMQKKSFVSNLFKDTNYSLILLIEMHFIY